MVRKNRKFYLSILILSVLIVAIAAFRTRDVKPSKSFLFNNQLDTSKNLIHSEQVSSVVGTNESTTTKEKIQYEIFNSKILKSSNDARFVLLNSTTQVNKTRKKSKQHKKKPVKVYRLNNSVVTHLWNVNDNRNLTKKFETLKLKDNKLLIRYKNRHGKKKNSNETIKGKNVKHSKQDSQARLIDSFKDNDDVYDKQAMLTNFLTKSKYFLNKLEKEAEIVEDEFRIYGKKYYHLLKSKLKKAYDEMRSYLCNAYEKNFSNIGFTSSSEHLYRDDDDDSGNMDKKRRRMTRYSHEKRLFKKICTK